MTLAALIFDADGTLADTEETHRQAFNVAFLNFGLDWEWSKPMYRKLLDTSGGKERITAFIMSLALPLGERSRLCQLVPAIHREKTKVYVDLIADRRCVLRPGVARLLDEASASGVRLAIASTTTVGSIEMLLTGQLGSDALRMFHCIVYADHVRHKKPAPDIYHLALATLGHPASHCVAFEDSANGLRAAKGAGLYTIVTPSQWTIGQDFRTADLALPHLGDAQHALPPPASALVGAPFLGLGDLQALHAAAIDGPAAAAA